MHKRRPCIVLSINDKWRTLQIIPLSTKNQPHGKHRIPISQSEFNSVARRYRNSNSTALLDMIQSVSWFRAYPLRGSDGRHLKHNAAPVLSGESSKTIEQNLTTAYMPSVTAQVTQLQASERKLREERKALQLKINQGKQDRSDLEAVEPVLRRIAHSIYGYENAMTAPLGDLISQLDSDTD